MNWGWSLLWNPFSALGDTVKGIGKLLGQLAYNISCLLFGLILKLWNLIAGFVDAIEGIFRGLAGLGDKAGSAGTDMASVLISNDSVQRIFFNLVGVSMALLIFFTIVKIIQQQYKEKDGGGNPYIIVFRLFKGMMMFFFVTAACLVGLYASGVVFRALDAATADGATSVSGQIFRAMAYDANRKRLGIQEGLVGYPQNVYYKRLTGAENVPEVDETDHYVIIQMTDQPASQAKVKAMAKELDLNQRWRIVNRDENGDEKLSLLTPLYSGNLWEDGFNSGDLKDAFENGYGEIWHDNIKDTWYEHPEGDYGYNGDASYDPETGQTKLGGTATYHNDLLNAINLNIQPKLSINWSPIRLKTWIYRLYQEGDEIPCNITTSVMGNSVTIPGGYRKYKYKQESEEPQIDDVKEFSFKMDASIGLQGGELAASFDFETFINADMVMWLFTNVAANNGIYYLCNYACGQIPELPLWFHFGPVEIDLQVIAGIIIVPILNVIIQGSLALIPGIKGDVSNWVNIGSERGLPITLQHYCIFDKSNFDNLASQFSDSWKDIKNQLDTGFKDDMSNVNKSIQSAEEKVGDLKTQQQWVNYKGLTVNYNNQVSSLLPELILYADEYVKYKKLNTDSGGVNSEYRDNMEDYSDMLKSTFQRIQNAYSSYQDGIRQCNGVTGGKATALPSLGQIYMPAVEIKYSGDKTKNMSADDIIEALRKKNNKNIVINLVTSSRVNNDLDLYQMINWDCYTDSVRKAYPSKGFYADTFASPDVANRSPYIDESFWSNISNLGDISHLFYQSQYAGSLQPLGFTGKFEDVFKEFDPYLSGSVDVNDEFSDKPYKTTNPKAYSTDEITVNSSKVNYNSAYETLKAQILWDDNQASSSRSDLSYRVFDDSDFIVFRNMDLYAQSGGEEGDTKVLREWIKSGTQFVPTGETKEIPVPNMSPDQIDSFMSTKHAGRNYLMLTESGKFTSYLGVCSYTDGDVVQAFYEPSKLNFFVGYFGIIIAVSTYLQFMFGLIQRAINLAVLYMMSPITIAFYPFDDGQKFKSSFVSPFYKEVISAYAIIISMNLFFVLLPVVDNAAKKVTSGNTIVGLFATIAFLTMLPKIRESITGLLGANSIQAKNPLDVMKEVSDMGKSPAKLAKAGANKIGGVAAKHLQRRELQARRKEESDKKFKDKMAEKQKNNKGLNFVEKARLAKLNGKEDKKRFSEDKMKEALAKKASGDKNWDVGLNKKEALMAKAISNKAMKDVNASGMFDKKNMSDQQKKNLMKKYGTKNLDDAIKMAKRDEANKKSTGKGFFDNTSKVLKNSKAYKAGNVAKDVGSAIGKAGLGLATGAPLRLAAQGIGKLADLGAQGVGLGAKAMSLGRTKLGGTYLGAMLENAEDAVAGSKGGFGDLYRFYNNPVDRDEAFKKKDDERVRQQGRRNEGYAKLNENLSKSANKLMASDEQIEQVTRDRTAREQIARRGIHGLGLSDAELEKRYVDSSWQNYMDKEKRTGNKNIDEAGARALASKDWNNSSGQPGVKRQERMFNESGAQVKLVDDLTYERNGLKLDESIMTNIKNQTTSEMTQNVEAVKQQRADMVNTTNTTVTNLMHQFQTGMGLSDSEFKGIPEMVLKNVTSGMNGDDIIKGILEKIPTVNHAQAMTQFASLNFNGEVANLQNGSVAQIANLDRIIDAINSQSEAVKSLKEIGLKIDSAEFDRFFNKFEEIHKSGGKLDVEIKNLSSSFSGEALQGEISKLTAKYNQELGSFMSKMASTTDVFMRDFANKHAYDAQQASHNEINKSVVKNLEFQTSQMPQDALMTVYNDKKWSDASIAGNHSAGATMMKNAIAEALRTQDVDKVKAFCDEVTAEKLVNFSRGGAEGRNKLEEINKLMNMTGEFGNGSIDGFGASAASNAMGRVYSIMLGNEQAQKFETASTMAFQREADFRASMNNFVQVVDSNYRGAWWNNMQANALNLVDESGNKVTDVTSFLSDVCKRLETESLSIDSSFAQDIKQKFSDLLNTTDPAIQSQLDQQHREAISNMLQFFGNCKGAIQQNSVGVEYKASAVNTRAKINDAMKKLQETK